MTPATKISMRATVIAVLVVGLFASCAFAAEPVVVFDVRGLTYDELCTVEALQGLANRSKPRLMLVDGREWNRKWIEIYRQEYGLEFQEVDDLRGLLRRFHSCYKGLVAYDSAIDGERCTALTLAGATDLLPVSSCLLQGWSARIPGNGNQLAFNFMDLPAETLSRWSRIRGSDQLVKEIGLQVESGEEPWRSISYGPLVVDLASYPVLEVAVQIPEGTKTRCYVKLVVQGNKSGAQAQPERVIALPPCQKGVERWNVAEGGGLQGRQTFSRIELHSSGAKAKMVWRAIRFASVAGKTAPGILPMPLTALLGTELREDLRGRFKSSTDVYEWALTEVIPRCNRRFAHTPAGPDIDGRRVGMGPFHGFDYAVMNRGVVFNLTHLEAAADSFGTLVHGDKTQADLYRRILAALEKPAFFVGYGEPENAWFLLLGGYGHSYLHWGDNLSFHSRVPAQKAPLQQKKQFAPETVQPEKKYYVCFVTSEGDTMKGPLSFFFGSWFDKRRGQVPMNWAIHPAMAKFPAMLEYYYRTATDNDYFVGVQAYNHRMPGVEGFARVVRSDMDNADLHVLSPRRRAEQRDLSADPLRREHFHKRRHPHPRHAEHQLDWTGREQTAG
jgi:hypothetical protein